MKLENYRSEVDAARAQARTWRNIAVGSCLAVVILSAAIYEMSTHDTKVIVVPPEIHKEFEITDGRASPEYMEIMTEYLLGLLLNITPSSVDANIAFFLRYVSPEVYPELKRELERHAEGLKNDGVTTIFYPTTYRIKGMSVVVGGEYVTYLGNTLVSRDKRIWAVEYSQRNSRIYILSTKEIGDEKTYKSMFDTDSTK